MKRAIISLVMGTALAVSPLTYAVSAPLAPGKAAGVKKAEAFMNNNTLMWVVGAGVVIGGVALVVSGGGNGHGVVSTCTPTTAGESCPPPDTGGTGSTSGT